MTLSNKLILFGVLVVAAVLRLYGFHELPYTHDELSALFRLSFGSFNELIEHGVKVDGHPAGVQVFLYYWVALFGEQAWKIKLPFALLGIGSVALVYAIGKKWFTHSVGLYSATFLAGLTFVWFSISQSKNSSKKTCVFVFHLVCFTLFNRLFLLNYGESSTVWMV